ncbi:MAG: Inorganic diphosphatase [Pedosphaera sp.]|nr:Inorganic diphosphatase [Pedosphaera sp.]
MKKLIDRLESFDSDKKCLNVIVETPKGSRIKYAYDAETGLFGLKRALPNGMMFPFNFGFIPSTLGDDGDPLDILILNEEPLIPGCLLKARLVAVIKARQTDDGQTMRNDRLIGVAIGKETPNEFEAIALNKKLCRQIEYFFVSYNQLDGKQFKVLGQGSPQKAGQIVRKGIKQYLKKKKSKHKK